MTLIKLESIDGKPIWVNPHWVVGLHKTPAGIQIVTGEADDAYWAVKGELDEVATILMGNDKGDD